MQIMVGRMWSNGKMFSVAGKDSCSRLSLSPRRRPARGYKHNRSVPIPSSALCGKIYARQKSYCILRPLQMLQLGSGKILQGMVKKYEVLHEAKSQTMKIVKFFTCQFEKRFKVIDIILEHTRN